MRFKKLIGKKVDRVSIKFEFSIKGKARPKFNGNTGTAYMPTSYVTNVDAIKFIIREYIAFYSRKTDFLSSTHGYDQRIVGYRKRRKPKNKKDLEWLEKHRPYGGLCFGCSGAPDLDNFIGTLMDASNGVLYPDDRQVVASQEYRIWSDIWGAEYTVIKREQHEWIDS